MAQARRWKMSSVVSLKKNKVSRQCLWALAMKSSKNTNYTKSTSLRIWDYFETGLSWILNYVKNRASAQSDWAFGASSYRFQPSLTHDVLFSVVQSVSEHSGLVAAKAAIGNWIVAYALSKVVVVQSVIRRWLVYRRNRDVSSHLSESIVPQIQHDDVGSNDADHDDIVCPDSIRSCFCCQQNQLLFERVQSWCHFQCHLQLRMSSNGVVKSTVGVH